MQVILYFDRDNHHGVFWKSGFLKPRINRGKILIIGNNNKTKAITIKVLKIFIVIVMAKCIAVVCNLGFSTTMQEIIVSVMT